ncbi:Druantia anti-phage system protein DruA [Acidithiobacillus sp.]|jgi:hypothetical protein|uniref:IS4/Tn5 family transposase DNA-binding protein n=1 Tax=Acidithiobacillus sp. TaxID=1872118 RepID=UPI003563CB5D
MDTQKQIKRILAQPDAIETIRQLQNDPTHKTRAAFARAVCQHFLIRTAVHCQNLASRVLGMVLRRLGDDYEVQYHYRPWLVESFVDTDQFAGTCYQAANWVAIGQTRGRGRQDRQNLRAKSIKAIYAYVLDSGFRAKMGVAEPVGLVSLEIAEGLDGRQWADQEFGGAQLGDQRLSERLAESARLLGAMPGRAFCGVAQGNWPAIKGYYRMIDQPDDAGVTMEDILAPHRRRTIQRMKGQSTVLCIQDGTDLNYSGLAQCEGLGVIGSNQTGTDSPGLHLHSTLVVSTEGVPLGLLNAQCLAPTPRQKGQPAASLPIEEKKTFAWIQGLRDCVAVAVELPDTRQVCVMDREADFYALFDEQHQKRKVDLLIRAKHNRATTEDLSLLSRSDKVPYGIFCVSQYRAKARDRSGINKKPVKSALHVQQRLPYVITRSRCVLRPGMLQKNLSRYG